MKTCIDKTYKLNFKNNVYYIFLHCLSLVRYFISFKVFAVKLRIKINKKYLLLKSGHDVGIIVIKNYNL